MGDRGRERDREDSREPRRYRRSSGERDSSTVDKYAAKREKRKHSSDARSRSSRSNGSRRRRSDSQRRDADSTDRDKRRRRRSRQDGGEQDRSRSRRRSSARASRSRSRSRSKSRSASGSGSRSESRESAKKDYSNNYDDKDGHYVFYLGESLTPRYKILSLLGEGTFGKCVECWDREKKDYVAVKIIRAVDKYREAALIEIDILKEISKSDPDGKRSGCVNLLSWFDYRGHVCMVFEKLGLSLYDFLRKNLYRPFSMRDTQHITRQILQSLAFLHDTLRLVHTDLKPENVLLVNGGYVSDPGTTSTPHPYRVPVDTAVKIIDFGSATFEDQHHTSTVCTRHYRAPEVILGLGWSYPCDIWSVGCIAIELYTGDALYQTHENLEHLAMMERVSGRIPTSMSRSASRSARKYFFADGTLRWPEGASSSSSVRHVRRMHRLRSLVAKEHRLFLDLVTELLEYDPRRRISARDALKHPFFSQVYND